MDRPVTPPGKIRLRYTPGGCAEMRAVLRSPPPAGAGLAGGAGGVPGLHNRQPPRRRCRRQAASPSRAECSRLLRPRCDRSYRERKAGDSWLLQLLQPRLRHYFAWYFFRSFTSCWSSSRIPLVSIPKVGRKPSSRLHRFHLGDDLRLLLPLEILVDLHPERAIFTFPTTALSIVSWLLRKGSASRPVSPGFSPPPRKSPAPSSARS